MSRHPHFIISASLGEGIQPTALAVVEQEIVKGRSWRAENKALRLRHLERLPLQESYPDIVARVSTLLEAPEVKDEERCGGAQVVLDVTGSGRAILELFEAAEIKPIVVTITGALEEKVDSNDWRVPKVELVGALRVVYETERLKMAKSLAFVPTLLDELRDFKMRPPRIDPSDPESCREGQFDDLVFAVALAAWRASRHVPTPQAIRDHWNEKIEKHRKKMNAWVV